MPNLATTKGDQQPEVRRESRRRTRSVNKKTSGVGETGGKPGKSQQGSSAERLYLTTGNNQDRLRSMWRERTGLARRKSWPVRCKTSKIVRRGGAWRQNLCERLPSPQRTHSEEASRNAHRTTQVAKHTPYGCHEIGNGLGDSTYWRAMCEGAFAETRLGPRGNKISQICQRS